MYFKLATETGPEAQRTKVHSPGSGFPPETLYTLTLESWLSHR